MRRALLLGLGSTLLSLAACLQLGTPVDPAASDASSSGASSVAASSTSGINCGVDPGSGVALCLDLASCPLVRVDPDQFPGCGYRISGGAIDLECICNGSLCPMGAAASCGDAQALLTNQSAASVCSGIAEGLCSALPQMSSPAPSNTSSACDKDCRSDCNGDPGCLTLCGC